MKALVTQSRAPALTFGYLAAGALAAGLWLGIGILLLPVMLVLAAWHWMASGQTIDSLAAEHHRWLARHHIGATVALSLVLILPVLAIPALLDTLQTLINTLVFAPHPFATLAAAWPAFDHLPMLFLAGLVLAFGWLAATIWISARLLFKGLRWAEGRPAR